MEQRWNRTERDSLMASKAFALAESLWCPSSWVGLELKIDSAPGFYACARARKQAKARSRVADTSDYKEECLGRPLSWRGGGAAVARVVRARLLCSHGPSSIQDKFSSHHHHITCAFNGPTHFPRSLLKSLLATFFSFYLYVLYSCLPSLIYIIKMLVSKFCVAGLSFWRQISNMCHKREIVHILNGKKGRKQQL